jgi:hypothetical protein
VAAPQTKSGGNRLLDTAALPPLEALPILEGIYTVLP